MTRLKLRKRWLALAAVPVLIAAVAAASLDGKATQTPSGESAAATSYAQSLSQAFRQAARQVQPSVVLIQADPVMPVQWKGRGEKPEGRSMEEWFDQMPFGNAPELRRFFEDLPKMPNPPRGGSGVGSGVIIDSEGVILTNNHVVKGRNEITVRLHDGREFKAVEVKSDPNTDLAVVRIEGAEDLQAAKLGDSDQIEIGDWVLALGHPFGLEGTVTSGIVSAKGRGIGLPARADFLQTDAAINPGNSGGPLVSLDGEVIGINTAISSRSGGNQGVGFAIPSNLAKWVSRQLIEEGTVRRAQLGVVIQPLGHELAEQFGLEPNGGVLVAEVMPDTPAAKAGLKPGDVIVEYDGQAVASPRELQAVVERSEPGAKQSLAILRDGDEKSLRVVPREQTAGAESTGRAFSRSESFEPSRLDKLGLEISALTPDVAEKLSFEADRGVVVTDVGRGGPADQAGLAPGMVILEADRKPLASTDDFRKALDGAEDGSLLLRVRSERGSRFVVLHLEK
jgi:serine protease Do